MKKALFVLGPTASGKTDLAVKIAKKTPSILISADAVQVFCGADIIAGKDHPKDIKINLIDVVKPTQSFSISDFLKMSEPLIEKSEEKAKLPIIVGGTGWYADSLYSKIETINVAPNATLRKKLESKTTAELQDELRKKNKDRLKKMNHSDINNKRRLIRAIEVAYAKNIAAASPIFKPDEVLFVGLYTSMDKLREKITQRVEDRIRDGAFGEASALFEDYDNLSSQIKRANGYKELFSYLKKEIDLDEARERWITADYRHAKKQMTWLARNKNINWFDIGERDYERKVLKLVRENFPSIDN